MCFQKKKNPLRWKLKENQYLWNIRKKKKHPHPHQLTLSISEIIFLISSFLGSKPRALIATFNSFASIVPDPSVSKRSKASRISCFCSSVSSNFLLF
mmetsp:Transcript_4077/g.5378  ORF Transcript_4077/g.5378 Transcript_4077/m.5378 type:complete len:97 (+) Transcript_4077:582-872(+)